MFQVVGRVTRSGPLVRKTGEIVTDKDDNPINMIEIGGKFKGFKALVDVDLTDLPVLNQRVVLHCIREAYEEKGKPGKWNESYKCSDWEPV